jgi:predicted permease
LRVPLSSQRYPSAARRVAFLRDVLRGVQNVPGVLAVGLNTGLHPLGNWNVTAETSGLSGDTRRVVLHQSNEDYPRAMGITVAEGRFFNEQEAFGQVHVAVVDQAFAQRYFPQGNALGNTVRIPRLLTPPANLADASFQIVGVVKNAADRIAATESLPEIYIPYTLTGMADRLAVLAQSSPSSLASAVREQVYVVDREQPVMEVQTLESALETFIYARPRFNLLLFAVFAGIGLVLALFGIYGVISNGVAQRTQEIGIRMALGAGWSQIIGMVLASGVRLVGLGILMGLGGSLASARFVASQVSRVSPLDPSSFAVVSLLLLVAGLFASFWPARRAARVDPASVLRQG